MALKVKDRVIVMLGEHHPSRGEVVEVSGSRVRVALDVLWPPGSPPDLVWFDDIELMKEGD